MLELCFLPSVQYTYYWVASLGFSCFHRCTVQGTAAAEVRPALQSVWTLGYSDLGEQ